MNLFTLKKVHKFIIRGSTSSGSLRNIVALFHAHGGSKKSHEWFCWRILFSVQKVYEELNGKGISVGRSRVQRIMHQHGIKAQIKSKYKPQTT
ncbi:MAG: transposase, partial [Prevotella sp.]|nr:transposase [Prevotella sp.]